MKNNIEYYPHFSNSHDHWKFELLRAKYDWQGEGVFWALNNLIARSENTILDINNKAKRASIAGKFKMDLTQFEEYLNYLATDCELIIYREGLITTDIVTNVMEGVTEKRKKERERINNWRKQQQSNKDVTSNKEVVRDIKESKVNKSKGKERKVKESIAHLFSDSPFYDFVLFEKKFTGTDYEFCDLKIYHEKIKNWSAGKGAKKIDWIATARTFMLGDKQEGKLQLKHGVTNGNNQTGKPTIEEVLNRLNDYRTTSK
jgi:hypothetical protein